MLTKLTSPPPSLSLEDLNQISASTPSSFEGIPPLLRHFEDNVEFFVDPPFEGVGGEGAGSLGGLCITEGALSFYSTTTSTGLLIPYPLITLHAISRAPMRSFTTATGGESTGGGPCIYCQVDEDEGDADEGTGTTREVIIIPRDPATLDKLFETLSICASLHPSAGSNESGLGGGGGGGSDFFDMDSMVYADANGNLAGPGIAQMTAEEEANEMSAAGRAAMAHNEVVFMPGNGVNGVKK